jgi:hypothetical protein
MPARRNPTVSQKPKPGSPTFAQDFKSHVLNILLANPYFAGICADLWRSARPNSRITKLLQANYQKILKENSMPTRTCKHIKVNGVRCGSPALRKETYCYFHYRMLCKSRISPIALLENEDAIQVSVMEIINSLLHGTIDLKRGELILRALNTAVRNSRRVRFEGVSHMVRELPKDPIVQPRLHTPSHEEIEAVKRAMLAGHSKPIPPIAPPDINVTQKKPNQSVKEVMPAEKRNATAKSKSPLLAKSARNGAPTLSQKMLSRHMLSKSG